MGEVQEALGWVHRGREGSHRRSSYKLKVLCCRRLCAPTRLYLGLLGPPAPDALGKAAAGTNSGTFQFPG